MLKSDLKNILKMNGFRVTGLTKKQMINIINSYNLYGGCNNPNSPNCPKNLYKMNKLIKNLYRN